LPQFRVLLADMPPMLTSLLADLIAADGDLVLAATVAEGGDLDAAIAASEPDVVILGHSDAAASEHDPILFSHPSLRLLLIDPPGHRGWIYQLTPQLVALDELTPATLLAAIRARPAPDVAPRSGT
jgi:hypothetical protein